MKFNVVTIKKTGFNSGRVILKKIFILFAPSTRAASYNSLGID